VSLSIAGDAAKPVSNAPGDAGTGQRHAMRPLARSRATTLPT
jgi:hypothetical protein